MRKDLFYCLFLFSILYTSSLNAGTMIATKGTYTPLSTSIINRQVSDIANDLNDEPMIKLSGNQNQFAQATNKSSTSLLLQGSMITGYDTKFISVGMGTGVGAENAFELSKMTDYIDDGKDKATSAAPGGIVGDLTLSGAIIPLTGLEDLLINIKGGGFSINKVAGKELSYDSFLLGLGGRYNFYHFANTGTRFKIRSLSLGTGVYYTSNNTTYLPKDLTRESTDSDEYTTHSTTELTFSIKSSNYTLPLDIVTSINVLDYFNVMFGAGVDFSFGTTTVDIKADSTIEAYSANGEKIETDDPATLTLTDSKTTASAPLARFKTIFGLGFSLGAARLDIPIAYYPSNGFSAAIVVGAVL